MLSQFAIRLIAGLSMTWCLMPRRQVTSGFFRIQMLVTLGLAVLAAVAAGKFAGSAASTAVLSAFAVQVISVGLAIASFLGSVLWTLERRAAGERCVFLIAAASQITVALGCVSPEDLRTLSGTLYWMSELATAWVSGAAVGGMLLGHWYLTTPTMSTSPLNRVNLWLGAASLLRLLTGLAALLLFRPWAADGPAADLTTAAAAAAAAATTATAAGQWNSTFGVWLSLEWLGGMLGPLLACVMVHRILKYRNTQSATGVLFVAVILAFLGEMTGALLRQELRLPL